LLAVLRALLTFDAEWAEGELVRDLLLALVSACWRLIVGCRRGVGCRRHGGRSHELVAAFGRTESHVFFALWDEHSLFVVVFAMTVGLIPLLVCSLVRLPSVLRSNRRYRESHVQLVNS